VISDRIIEDRPWRKVIRVAHGHYLYVEEREYYTRYRMANGFWHEVRNCRPLETHHRRIIYARTIPWFMWLWYGMQGIPRRIREWREFRRWAQKDKEKRRQILAYQRRVSERQFVSKNRFGGRYNR
jgi:hypothetical protein